MRMDDVHVFMDADAESNAEELSRKHLNPIYHGSTAGSLWQASDKKYASVEALFRSGSMTSLTRFSCYLLVWVLIYARLKCDSSLVRMCPPHFDHLYYVRSSPLTTQELALGYGAAPFREPTATSAVRTSLIRHRTNKEAFGTR